MSIATKKGDDGTTGLMYNRRVSKCDPRVEAYACVDELNSALGMARATAKHDFVSPKILTIQKDLVNLMGELATAVEDLERYRKDGFISISGNSTDQLDKWVQEIEGQNITYKGWATPGTTVHSAALDVARATCRRAERRVCALQEKDQLCNAAILVYLNRLSDLLWLFARWAETQVTDA